MLQVLRTYINQQGITQKELAKEMNITPCTLYNWLNGKIKLSDKKLNLLLKCLGQNDIESIKNQINEYKELPTLDIKRKLKEQKISYEKMSKELGISYTRLRNCLNGKTEFSPRCSKLILDYMNKLNSELSDESKTNDFFEIKEDEDEDIQLHYRKILNSDLLYELLNEYEITGYELRIINFLFQKENGRFYTIERIMKITGASESEILKIYKKCLKLYSDYFRENENVYTLRNVQR